MLKLKQKPLWTHVFWDTPLLNPVNLLHMKIMHRLKIQIRDDLMTMQLTAVVFGKKVSKFYIFIIGIFLIKNL